MSDVPSDDIFQEPRYPHVPATQTPILRDDKIVAWVARVGMTDQGVTHFEDHYYVCQPEEVLPENDPTVNRVLEEILNKIEEETKWHDRCADALEAKVAAIKQKEV